MGDDGAIRHGQDGLEGERQRRERVPERDLEPDAVGRTDDAGQTERFAFDARETVELRGLPNGGAERVGLKGLGEIAKNAVLDRFGGAFDRRPAGEEYDGQIGVVFADGAQQVEPASFRAS